MNADLQMFLDERGMLEVENSFRKVSEFDIFLIAYCLMNVQYTLAICIVSYCNLTGVLIKKLQQ